MLLHKEDIWTLWVHGNVMHAVADFGFGIRNVLGTKALVDWLPSLAAIVRAKSSSRRDGDKNPLRITGIQNDGVQAHAAGAGLPLWSGAVAAQAGKFVPRTSAVGCLENGSIFDARIHRIWIR